MRYLIVIVIRSRILLKYLKITEILSFLEKNVLSKCIKYCFNMALYCKNFSGRGGGKTKSATVRFFPGSAPGTAVGRDSKMGEIINDIMNLLKENSMG